MRLLVESRIGCQSLIYLREVSAHARAKISQRTAGVDKSYQQYLAAKLFQPDLLIALVQELEVRHFIAGLNRMIEVAWLVIGLGLRHYDDLIEQVGVVGGKQSCRNAVAGMKF